MKKSIGIKALALALVLVGCTTSVAKAAEGDVYVLSTGELKHIRAEYLEDLNKFDSFANDIVLKSNNMLYEYKDKLIVADDILDLPCNTIGEMTTTLSSIYADTKYNKRNLSDFKKELSLSKSMVLVRVSDKDYTLVVKKSIVVDNSKLQYESQILSTLTVNNIKPLSIVKNMDIGDSYNSYNIQVSNSTNISKVSLGITGLSLSDTSKAKFDFKGDFSVLAIK